MNLQSQQLYFDSTNLPTQDKDFLNVAILGVQGPPGLKFQIKGSPQAQLSDIIIGPSGIWEWYYPYNTNQSISRVKFLKTEIEKVLKNSNNLYVIIDTAQWVD